MENFLMLKLTFYQWRHFRRVFVSGLIIIRRWNVWAVFTNCNNLYQHWPASTKLCHIFPIFSAHRIEVRCLPGPGLTLLERDKFDRDLTWTVRCIDSIVSMREKNSLISYNLELSLFSDQFWAVTAVSFAKNIWSDWDQSVFRTQRIKWSEAILSLLKYKPISWQASVQFWPAEV